MHKYLFALFLVFTFPAVSGVDMSAYSTRVPETVSLNRVAPVLSLSSLSRFAPAFAGFRWNSSDDNSTKWMPQGITSFYSGGRHFVAATWYGVPSAGYANRGVRISLTDVTDLENGGSVKYRVVLLVDSNGDAFTGMHGGGIAYVDGELHVVDSRSSATPQVHVFPLNNFRLVPSSDIPHFYNYWFILIKDRTYTVAGLPSYISYDGSSDTMISGTFSQCSGGDTKYGCFVDEEAISLDDSYFSYQLSDPLPSASSCTTHFCSIQGVATYNDETWISSSYGRYNPSYLRVAYSPDLCYTGGSDPTVYEFEWPPGLEDLHIDPSTGYLWTLTEFGPRQGSGNHRDVVVLDRDFL